MAYTPNPTWVDGQAGGTPITAASLQHIEDGLAAAAAAADNAAAALPSSAQLVPAAGTSGQVLTVVSGVPAWATPSTGGAAGSSLANPIIDPSQATIDGMADGTYYAITT